MSTPTTFALRIALGTSLLVIGSTAAQCQGDARAPRSERDQRAGPAQQVAPVSAPVPPGATFDPPSVSVEEQQRVLLASARTAWSYVSRNYFTQSGLVGALETWRYVTIWDITGALAAYHAAHGLGLIPTADYRRRMDQALATLESMALYESVAFNKQYDARNAAMVDRSQERSTRGFGWSALDMGRFLVWLKVIAENDPAARASVQRIVDRLDLGRMARNGYLVGATTDLKHDNHYEYQEGRIGYEQYAAQGLALWGVRADSALDFRANGKPIDILGHRILADRRGDEYVTSEPFLMMGMELGWASPEWESQARNVLAAQRERFNRTKIITMVSEDAIPVKPAHFYYYLLHGDGKDFVVRAPGGAASTSYPRWISAKAAFGWHALFPSDYTWSAVRAVRPAGASGRGWTAGVYERSKRATPSFNLNTAAMVLEAAYYAQRKCAFIKPEC
ncbi:MAG: DUF3131 domain-containing protein [Gemmatimonadaceae bacterium]